MNEPAIAKAIFKSLKCIFSKYEDDFEYSLAYQENSMSCYK